MELPLRWALVLYVIGAGVFIIVAALNIYHMFRFGTFDRRNLVMIFWYIAVVVVIFLLTAGYFATVDWNQPIPVSAPSITLPFLH